MAEHRRRTHEAIPHEHVHTPAGMTDPSRDARPDDAADVASTDMDANPSGPNDPPPAIPEVAKEESRKEEAPKEGNRSELDELRDRHLRLAAEFDNFRKRVARERADLTDRAQASLAGRLLDVLDDMERLVVQAEQGATPDAFREGVTLVDRKLRKELEAAGLERIDPVGQTFDPQEQEAVSVIAPPKPDDDHLVSATLQPGYRFKGVLVRPARVQVYSGQGHA